MVREDGCVKILDFGLAKPAPGVSMGGSELPTQAKTQEGTLVGTLYYMSPEQATGKPADPRSDIFSLGIVFYEMLTGRRPFEGETPGEILSAIVKDTPRTIAEIRPDVPRGLSRIVRRCLEKDPKHRVQTALDVRNELNDREEWDETQTPRSSRHSRWLMGALGLSLLALIVTWLGPARPGESTPRVSNPRRVTSAPGAEDYPTWSPDGGRLAFESDRDIWVVQLGGGDPVRLTATPDTDEWFPAWSPDGSQIAYQSGFYLNSEGIFGVPAVGGAPRKLVPGEEPVWSPSGKELASLNGPIATRTLEIFSLEDQKTRRLELGKRCGEPSWSPDGQYLACIDASNFGFADLWLFPLSGDEPVLVAEQARSPTWSPEGSRLFFVSDRGESQDLWVLLIGEDGIRRGEPRAVTAGLMMGRAAVSPDGTKLAYSSGQSVRQVWRLPLFAERPATWNDARQITFDFATARFPAVSSDGRVVLSSDRSGNEDIWILEGEGQAMRQLTTHPSRDFRPAWSPDGKWIVFASSRSGNPDLWIVPSAGGPARQLTSHAANETHPDWSPDGEEIAFRSSRSGNPDIWVISAEGGEPRRVTTNPAIEQSPAWSPDGNWLVFQSEVSNWSVWRVPAAGGEPELLTTRWGFGPEWSPDGSRVFFHCSWTEICSLSPQDGVERVVVDFRGRPGQRSGSALAADNEFLYFVWMEDEVDLWVMDIVMDEG